MELSNVELPSEKKFGLFFTLIFLVISSYFYVTGYHLGFRVFVIASVVFFVISVLRPDILSPLNKLWMRLGLLLGLIVSPIIMGLIFFVIFAPIGILMRIMGRDELRLCLEDKQSHWIERDKMSRSVLFRLQY